MYNERVLRIVCRHHTYLSFKIENHPLKAFQSTPIRHPRILAGSLFINGKIVVSEETVLATHDRHREIAT